MNELTFPCPSCGQSIQCDASLGGQKVICPVCQMASMAPMPGGPKRLSVTAVNAPASAPGGLTPAEQMNRMYAARSTAQKAPSAGMQTAKTVVFGLLAVIAIGIGVLYFAFPEKFKELENKFGFAGKTEDSAVAGQVGHISELNSVLDATDPARLEGKKPRNPALGTAGASANPTAPKPAETASTLVPLIWTLNLEAATIPSAVVKGEISSGAFTADYAQFDRGVLDLRHGTNTVPDREILIYLRLRPGEKIDGKTITVTADQKTSVPVVLKKWKHDPRYAPQQRQYGSGYAMKLEFGEVKDGITTGKIYLALPDTEKSYIAGTFNAGAKLTAQSEAVPGQPTAPDAYSKENADFKARYGKDANAK